VRYSSRSRSTKGQTFAAFKGIAGIANASDVPLDRSLVVDEVTKRIHLLYSVDADNASQAASLLYIRSDSGALINQRLAQSDSKRAPGHLSHEGPELSRWVLFEAAQQASRGASPDHAYYHQVAERIDHKRPCLSVARKLCRRAHHILRELGDEALAPFKPDAQHEEATAAAA
jgi:hypothetical protein